MGPWFVTYSREAPVEISLVVVRDEGCLLTVETPLAPLLPERPEIGSYFWKCPSRDAEALRDLAKVAMDVAAGLPNPAVPPGTRFLSFGIGKKGEEKVDPTVSLPLSKDLPITAIAFDKAALDLAAKALDHPYLTLRASAKLAKPTWQTGGELGLRLTLSNVGTVPLGIQNPAGGERPRVAVLLRDAEDELAFIETKKGEVSAATTEPTVVLAPGAALELTIKLRRRTYLRRGKHNVTVRFTSEPDGIPDAQAIAGFVHAPAGTLTVQGKPGKAR